MIAESDAAVVVDTFDSTLVLLSSSDFIVFAWAAKTPVTISTIPSFSYSFLVTTSLMACSAFLETLAMSFFSFFSTSALCSSLSSLSSYFFCLSLRAPMALAMSFFSFLVLFTF